MSEDQQILNMIFQFIVLIVGMGCATGIITSWIKRRAPKPINSPEIVQRLDEITDRLTRLETATDTVALEVERISEGQRFTSKLLADRASASTVKS